MSAAIPTESIRGARDRRKQDIERQARDALARSPYPQLRGLKCEYDAGVVTLRGSVPSFYALQVALNLVRRQLDGDVLIRNQVNVNVSPLDTGDGRPS